MSCEVFHIVGVRDLTISSFLPNAWQRWAERTTPGELTLTSLPTLRLRIAGPYGSSTLDPDDLLCMPPWQVSTLQNFGSNQADSRQSTANASHGIGTPGEPQPRILRTGPG